MVNPTPTGQGSEQPLWLTEPEADRLAAPRRSVESYDDGVIGLAKEAAKDYPSNPRPIATPNDSHRNHRQAITARAAVWPASQTGRLATVTDGFAGAA
jgi:hypothetical protein